MASAYIVPFVVYLLGTVFISKFGEEAYPLAYSGVAAVVAVVLVVLLRGKKILRPHFKVGEGVLVGTVGIVLWILLAHFQESWVVPYLPSFLQPEERMGFNPFQALSGTNAWLFVAVRVLGIAVLVPIAEELFWRGFLLRWLVDPDWEQVKLGEFSWQPSLIVVAMFTLAHPEWFAAATYCLLLNGLLYWKKDLWQCIVAHAVSNLLLVVYVLATAEWWLW